MKSSQLIKAFGLCAAGAFLISTARGAPILLYNTGVDASGTPRSDQSIGDLHYSLVSVPGGSTTTEIRRSAGGFPIGPWLGDDSISAWIGPAGNDPAAYKYPDGSTGSPHQLIGPGGIYIYRTTFSLAGLDPSTAFISGLWSSDNGATDILLNGNSTGQTIPYGTGPSSYSFSSWTTFSLTSGFVSGLNTIDFVVVNGNGDTDINGPTGLRVEMTGTAAEITPPSAVPDGGMTVTLLGFALVGVEGLRRRLAA